MISDALTDEVVETSIVVNEETGEEISSLIEPLEAARMDRDDAEVTRGEFASFLYRAAKPRFSRPKAKVFSDVATSNSHHAAIAWMKKSGLSTGYADRTFKPNRSISRGEVAAIMHRYHQSR